MSCCYRIDTALELFENNYSEQFKVKFQDDLSQSSNSDDMMCCTFINVCFSFGAKQMTKVQNEKTVIRMINLL